MKEELIKSLKESIELFENLDEDSKEFDALLDTKGVYAILANLPDCYLKGYLEGCLSDLNEQGLLPLEMLEEILSIVESMDDEE